MCVTRLDKGILRRGRLHGVVAPGGGKVVRFCDKPSIHLIPSRPVCQDASAALVTLNCRIGVIKLATRERPRWASEPRLRQELAACRGELARILRGRVQLSPQERKDAATAAASLRLLMRLGEENFQLCKAHAASVGAENDPMVLRLREARRDELLTHIGYTKDIWRVSKRHPRWTEDGACVRRVKSVRAMRLTASGWPTWLQADLGQEIQQLGQCDKLLARLEHESEHYCRVWVQAPAEAGALPAGRPKRSATEAGISNEAAVTLLHLKQRPRLAAA